MAQRKTPRKGKARSAVGRKPATPKAAPRGDLEKRLAEVLAQQAATSEILHAIRTSPADVQPVFDMIADRAMRLCGGVHAGVLTFDGDLLHLAAHVAVSPDVAEVLPRTFPTRPSARTASTRAVLARATVHIPDIERDPDYVLGDEARRAGFRSALSVPMLRDDQPIGAIVVFGPEPVPFSERQVDLLRTFADQAVIAIENARLFEEARTRNRELSESLEQQAATTEILSVISSSPTDVQPVFDAIVASASRLCEAEYSAVARLEDGQLHLVAVS